MYRVPLNMWPRGGRPRASARSARPSSTQGGCAASPKRRRVLLQLPQYRLTLRGASPGAAQEQHGCHGEQPPGEPGLAAVRDLLLILNNII